MENTDFFSSIVTKYETGTLDITSLLPKDFLKLQSYLLKHKKYQDVQKFASIARNRAAFTGKLPIVSTEKPLAVT